MIPPHQVEVNTCEWQELQEKEILHDDGRCSFMFFHQKNALEEYKDIFRIFSQNTKLLGLVKRI